VLAIWPLALLLDGAVLFSTATDTMLSIYLLRLTAEVVTDDIGHVVDGITIRQQTTGEANVDGV
jgi:hypothetical protein